MEGGKNASGYELKLLRVNMTEGGVRFEKLPPEWLFPGGRGIIARILRGEVPPASDPLGPDNKLVFAAGPLAGTLAPQLGRLSVGSKSPLTLGVKESNAGGTAAQKLDRLGIRAVVLEGRPAGPEDLFLLLIHREGAELVPAGAYRGMKVFGCVERLKKEYGEKAAIICIGPAGERMYKSASVTLTDMLGDPSRNAGRGGLGAVMGAKGVKAIVIDDEGSGMPPIADRDKFRDAVHTWVDMIHRDVTCGLFSSEGTPFTISSNAFQGTMPGNNYRTGRPDGFQKVTGEVSRRKVWDRGGRMHACMPGCVVQCSIIYYDDEGRKTSAYEYEAVSMLGTNLNIPDTDAIARLKHTCDDLGVDFIEVGSAMGVAAEAGKLTLGDEASAARLLSELAEGTELGAVVGNGVVSTAEAFGIERVPAFKGQALPAHDPRAVKAIGVTYATSPMGADHTAGLCYKDPLSNRNQVFNSLRFQLRAAACDTFGYCLNSLPGRKASIYSFVAELLQARFGTPVTADQALEIAKQTIRDERAFNQGAEFSQSPDTLPEFVRAEALPPTGSVFDVSEKEMTGIWAMMESYREPEKVWEVRLPRLPDVLFGAGVVGQIGRRAAALKMKKALLIADPVMEKLGQTARIGALLKKSGVDAAVYTGIEPDPPVQSIERAGEFYRGHGCDGIIALGGGSVIDTSKATAVRVSHPGPLTEYENMVGGKSKIKPTLPPLIAVPTTSGTGSETNQYAIITDTERNVKFTLMSDYMIPSLAVVDPRVAATMPPGLTAETGVDALAHCVEGYAGMNDEYHPYYEALALYGVKLIGRSLRRAVRDGGDLAARTDMCMAASFGGISFSKGLGLGHAVSHVLGAFYHVSHGKGCGVGLLCHVRASRKAAGEQFADLAWALGRTADLEEALTALYRDIGLATRIGELGVREEDLPRIAFEVSLNAVNLAANPEYMTERKILSVLREFY